MPYFIYYVTENPLNQRKQLEYLDTQDHFKTARTLTREHRAAIPADMPNRDCRLIFARNQPEAEKLLSAPREERVIGED